MSKANNALLTSKIAVNKDGSKTGILKKSDSPKTVKETIKLVFNLFLNLFS